MRKRIIAAAFIGAALCAGQAYAQGKPSPPAASSSSAPAAPKPLAETLTGEARADYEAGKILYQARDYGAALIKFEHAYTLSKDPRLLWNAAICQKGMRRYSLMLATIERLLAEGGSLLTEKDKQDAAEVVRTVQTFVSPLKLTANEAGALVLVDSEQVGTTPLSKQVLLDVGVRSIRVTKPGYKDIERRVTVIGVSDVTLDVKLRKEIHRGRLTVVAGPNDLISIDGFMVAKGRFEGSLPSGGHTLLVASAGMQSYQNEVVLQDNQSRSIEVSLNPQPTGIESSKWPWIAGGAVLLIGAVVGGVLVFQPEQPIAGTINANPIQLHFDFGGRR